MTTEPPLIGACLGVSELPTYRDWLIEGQRDLELQGFTTPDVLNGDWQSVADETKRLLDGYEGRLGIHGPFRGFAIDSTDPDIQTVVQKRLDQGLDVCERLGATQMVIHSPYKTWDGNNLENVAGARDKKIDATHACIGAAVTRAGDLGVELVVENIEDTDPEDRLVLIESFNSDALQLSIDTGHAHYAHGSTGAPPVDYFVTLAGERLRHVHLQDADGYADRHWGIGKGTVRWDAVFSALAALEVKPRLVLELRNKAEIPGSMDFLISKGLGR